jgi:hypothetical protein
MMITAAAVLAIFVPVVVPVMITAVLVGTLLFIMGSNGSSEDAW